MREHDAVRRALGRYYRYIFVDEFRHRSDTGGRSCFASPLKISPSLWQDSLLRDGAIFMVGDPQQAIYRFRGADVNSYREAREAIVQRWPNNIIQITANSGRGRKS